MTNEEIKRTCEGLYKTIRLAEDGLKELRARCKHEKTFEGNYSTAPGHIQRAVICEYCGAVVRYKD